MELSMKYLIICQEDIDLKKNVYNLQIFLYADSNLLNFLYPLLESNLDGFTCKGINYNAHTKRLGLEMLFYLILENMIAYIIANWLTIYLIFGLV